MFHETPPVQMDFAFGKNMEFHGDAAQALMIDPSDLLREAEEHCGKIVYWGNMEAEAGFIADQQKQYVKTVRAQRYEAIKERLVDAGGKPTEAALAARMETDDAVINAEAALSNANRIHKQAKAVYEAVKNRKDLILTVNRQITASGEDNPVAMEESAPARRRR